MRGIITACSRLRTPLEATGKALAQDVLSAGHAEKETTKTILYIRAAHSQAHSLSLDPFSHIKATASDAIETISDFKQRVRNTEKAVREVRTCLGRLAVAIRKAGWNLNMHSLASAASVPTASPYQLRCEALFEREDIVAELAARNGVLRYRLHAVCRGLLTIRQEFDTYLRDWKYAVACRLRHGHNGFTA